MKKFLLYLFLAAGCANRVPVEEPKQAHEGQERKVQSFTMKWNTKCQCMVYITVYTYEGN
ncbi:MAG TPA: hypothetical protein VIY48_05035 [Candidatus Paceibacterota bacterium]